MWFVEDTPENMANLEAVQTIYIKSDRGSKIKIGRILVDVLEIIYDKHNYARHGELLGIDRSILTAEWLDYSEIVIHHRGERYWTTPDYFLQHCISLSIDNGRDMLFLEKRKFGLERALAYEKEVEFNRTAQLDMFGDNKSEINQYVHEIIQGEKLMDGKLFVNKNLNRVWLFVTDPKNDAIWFEIVSHTVSDDGLFTGAIKLTDIPYVELSGERLPSPGEILLSDKRAPILINNVLQTPAVLGSFVIPPTDENLFYVGEGRLHPDAKHIFNDTDKVGKFTGLVIISGAPVQRSATMLKESNLHILDVKDKADDAEVIEEKAKAEEVPEAEVKPKLSKRARKKLEGKIRAQNLKIQKEEKEKAAAEQAKADAEKLKKETEEKNEKILADRIKQLEAAGFKYDGYNVKFKDMEYSQEDVLILTEEEIIKIINDTLALRAVETKPKVEKAAMDSLKPKAKPDAQNALKPKLKGLTRSERNLKKFPLTSWAEHAEHGCFLSATEMENGEERFLVFKVPKDTFGGGDYYMLFPDEKTCKFVLEELKKTEEWADTYANADISFISEVDPEQVAKTTGILVTSGVKFFQSAFPNPAERALEIVREKEMLKKRELEAKELIDAT